MPLLPFPFPSDFLPALMDGPFDFPSDGAGASFIPILMVIRPRMVLSAGDDAVAIVGISVNGGDGEDARKWEL